MLQEIEKLINQSKLKYLSSSRLENQIQQLLGEDYSRRGGYFNFERILKQLCAQGVLEPVKASGTNGRNPLLYNRYRKVSLCLEQGLRLNLINLHSLIIQMICLTALTEDTIFTYFQAVYSLRLRPFMGKDYMTSKIERGFYQIDPLEEELRKKRQIEFDWELE